MMRCFSARFYRQNAAVVLLIMFSSPLLAALNIVEDLVYDDQSIPIRMSFHFATSVEYLSHIPREAGSAVFINLRLSKPGDTFNYIQGDQLLVLPKKTNLPINKISAHLDQRGELRLNIQFVNRQRFQLQIDAQKNILHVVLPDVAFQLKSDEQKLAQKLKSAKKALREQKYNQAIVIYTNILNEAKNNSQKEALEYLGVARQRNGQDAHAKKAFDQYLKQYPDGEDAVRVRQRLSGLLAGDLKPKKPLAKPRKKTALDSYSSSYISQYFYYFGSSDMTFKQRGVVNSLGHQQRLRFLNSEIKMVFDGTNQINLNAESMADLRTINDGEADFEFNNLYLRYKQKKQGLYLNLGRSYSSTLGVWGRIDGAQVAYPIWQNTALNIQLGYPVDWTSKQTINTSRPLMAASFSIIGIQDSFDITPYISTEYLDNLVNRQGLGFHASYYQKRNYINSFFEYDTHFNKANMARMQSQFALNKRWIWDADIDVRRLPLLQTQTALTDNKFAATSLAQLQQQQSDAEIMRQAMQKTGMMYRVSNGWSYQLSDDVEFNLDLDWSYVRSHFTDDLSTIVADRDFQRELAGQVYLSDLLFRQNALIMSARMIDANNFRSYQIDLRDRYVTRSRWQLTAQTIFYLREADMGGAYQTMSPSLIVSKEFKRSFWLQVEIGREYSFTPNDIAVQKNESPLMNLSYRFYF